MEERSKIVSNKKQLSSRGMARCEQLLIFLLIIISPVVFSKTQLYNKPPRVFNNWIKQEMQNYHIPGVSIAVIKNYKIKWARGYGSQNLLTKKPVNQNTMFEVGSLSKPVAAMMVLRAAQKGIINLDANVNKYLMSWKIPNNKFDKEKHVSFRLLLSHTAGINVHGFQGYASGSRLPTLLKVLNGEKPANSPAIRVVSKPGVKREYSGGGYAIIQQALIDIYHKPFYSIANHLIFKPLNMKHTTFKQPLPKQFSSFKAAPYYLDGAKVKGGAHTVIAVAAGGLWSSASDYAKFIIAVQKSLKGSKLNFLKIRYAKLMVQPFINPHQGLGFETNVNRYGNQVANGDYFRHPGEIPGYQSMVLASRLKGNGVVILTNASYQEGKSKNAWDFIHAVIKRIAGNNNWT